MPLTVTRVSETVFGNKRIVIADVVGHASSYLAGGEALGAAQLGMAKAEHVHVNPANAVASRLLAAWISATSKLWVGYPTGGVTASPAALADPLSTTGASTASAVDATTPNITPGRGKEVLNATNLSTATWRVMAFGE